MAASTSRAMSSTQCATTPSLHALHNTPHEALICAWSLGWRHLLDESASSLVIRGGRCCIAPVQSRTQEAIEGHPLKLVPTHTVFQNRFIRREQLKVQVLSRPGRYFRVGVL